MLKRKKQIIAKVMATTMLSSTLASTFVATASAAQPKATVNSNTILAGTDRYETAIKISENGWSSATNAVLINGETGLVDALTATPYASLKNAPILITHKDNLTPATLTRLKAMNVKNVDIVGGVNSISENVVNQLKANGMTVNRIAGNSRYETGLEVAKAMDKISDVSKIAVVNGEKGLPDAVSVAAPAADNKMPIILAHPTNGLDAATKTFINEESISKSYVIGSTTSMPESIVNSLPGTKTRLGGTDRHDTNAKVIKEFYTQNELDNIYVAKSGYVNNDTELVDALAAGVLAAKNDDPVLIVGKTLGTTQESLLKDKSFTKITQIGGNIPTASINAIKDTQKDPEATVSTVTLVNYKTIKITGKELNRINRSNVSISGNTTSSYTVNSAGTEATVEFANAFSNGTNTVKITSNLGNTTTHTFTYSTGISTVEATTKEVATEGIQYLEFTVNGGQKRTIEELKALGWTVKFQSTRPIFYKLTTDGNLEESKTSSTGQLKTSSKFEDKTTFDYEVILTNGTQEIKSGKVAVLVKDKTNNVKSINAHSLTFGANGDEKQLNGTTLLVGEKAKMEKVKITNLNGADSELTNSGYTLTSSNPNVVTVGSQNTLEAKEAGTTTITITVGDKTKTFTLTVKNLVGNERKATSATFNTSSLNLVAGKSNDVTVTVKDQYGDPIIGDVGSTGLEVNNKEIKDSSKNTIATASNLSKVSGSIKGEYTTKVTAENDVTATKSGILKIQYNGKDLTGSMTVNVTPTADKNKTYKLEIASDSKSKDFKIDKFDDSDNEIKLVLNEYINTSYLLNSAIALDNYTVESSNTNIAKVTKNTTDNKIEIGYGKSTGTATIKVYDKSTPKKQVGSTITVTVVDNTPKIKTINLNTVKDITELKEGTDKEFSVEDIFDITKVKISSGSSREDKIKNVVNNVTVEGTIEAGNNEVLLDLRSESNLPVLFIDKDNNGEYDETDQLLATIDMTTDAGITNTETDDAKRYVNLDTSQKGNIIVRLYHGTYDADDKGKSPFASKTIRVNIED